MMPARESYRRWKAKRKPAMREPTKGEKHIRKILKRVFTPRRETSATLWMEDNYVLPGTSGSVTGDWEAKPYQVAMADLMGSESRHPRRIVFPKSVRIGWTATLVGASLYNIVHRRKHVKFHFPTDEIRNSFASLNAEPALAACKPAADLIDENHDGRTKANTFRKLIGGKVWQVVGASMKTQLGDSTDIIVCDEVASMRPNTDDGFPIINSIWRAARVSPYRRIVIGSAPSMTNEILQEEEANTSMKFEYAIKCPACSALIPLIWERLRVDGVKSKQEDRRPENERRAATAHYWSQCCGAKWKQPKLMPAMEAGRWQTENGTHIVTGDHDPYLIDAQGQRVPWPEAITMHIWAAYGPEVTWRDLMLEWIIAQKSQVAKAAFLMHQVGRRPFNEDDFKLNSNLLMNEYRRDFTKLPVGCIKVFATVDVQADRLSVAIFGFSENAETLYVIARTDFRASRKYTTTKRVGLHSTIGLLPTTATKGKMATTFRFPPS